MDRMNTLKHFEQVGRRGFYRPVGMVTFEQAIQTVAEGMRHARSLELADLLVNTSGLSGFPTPDVFARYSLASKWAESAGASLRVALVARAEIIDPEKIGVLMAQNRGVSGDVFTNEAAAIAWLDLGGGTSAANP
jgi:hypothetical protein